jgi:hypothetical protein
MMDTSGDAFSFSAPCRARPEHLDLSLPSPAPERILEGLARGLVGVGLGRARRRRGAGDLAPVIQHLGDVGDPLRALGEAEEEVVVLAAVEPMPEASDLREEAVTEDRQVGDVVHRRGDRGSSPAEERQSGGRLLELVLIGIDEVEIAILVQTPHDLEEGLWRQLVVVIKERDEIACRRFSAWLRPPRCPGCGQVFHTDPRLAPTYSSRIALTCGRVEPSLTGRAPVRAAWARTDSMHTQPASSVLPPA